MAEISFPLENVEYSAQEAQLWFSGRTSGVFAAGELGVTAAGGMKVYVGKGRAWLAYEDFAGLAYANTVRLDLTAQTSDANYDRIDRVIIRFDRTGNTVKAMILNGTPASSPTAPAITRNTTAYDISLARIRVKKGVTAITAADITDERLNPSVCGIMRDGATGIDTSTFSSQWEALMQRVEAALNDVTDGSILTMKRGSATLLASAWTRQDSGEYTQTVTVSGILETDSGRVDVDMSDATVSSARAIMDAWARVGRIYTVSGGITAVCYDTPPRIDIPVYLEVIG